jgi:hypothetical protein
MSVDRPEDETQAPGHFGNQGKAKPKSKKVDLEEQYQRTRERAPSGENPSSEPVEADK